MLMKCWFHWWIWYDKNEEVVGDDDENDDDDYDDDDNDADDDDDLVHCLSMPAIRPKSSEAEWWKRWKD